MVRAIILTSDSGFVIPRSLEELGDSDFRVGRFQFFPIKLRDNLAIRVPEKESG
jgi:hypothetical protein